MFVGIDHVMICVSDLAQGIEQYRRLGFNVHPGGVHPGKGTHNAIAFNREDYIELLAIHDAAEHDAEERRPYGSHAGIAAFIAAGGGLRWIVLQSDDLDADVAAMRRRGFDIGDPRDAGRRTETGQDLRWKSAVPGPKNPLPVFFIQHLTPLAERRTQVPGAAAHPNGVQSIERAYIVTQDAAGAASLYAKMLGVPEPKLQKGTVIMADMAIFPLGAMSLGVVQPYAPGPAADALQRRGPGPFQALYRTTSMGAAARWMQEHGLPPLARGVRNTGEQAMLVPPEHACGASIGFVGLE